MLSLMIVEDEKDIREGIRDGIEWNRYGIEVADEAANGREALGKIKTTPVDIVITDVVMPFLSGIEFVRGLRAAGLDPEIIFISGYQDLEYLKSAFKLEAIDYLFKPVDIDELDAVLKRTVETRKRKIAALSSDRGGVSAAQASADGGESLPVSGSGKPSGSRTTQVDYRLSEDVVDSIKRGDVEGTRRALRVFIETIRTCGPHDLTLIRDLFIEVVISVNKMIADIDSIAVNPIDWEPIHSIRSFVAMTEWLRSEMGRTVEAMHSSKESRSTLMIERMKREIRQRLSEDISTKVLAKHFQLTPNYISRLFKQETGETFHAFVTSERLGTAVRLLADPTRKLYQIANEVGYKDADYFTKVFKKHFGMSPKEYRNKVL